MIRTAQRTECEKADPPWVIALFVFLVVGHLVLAERRHAAMPETQLLRAVQANDLARTSALLAGGVNVNHRFPNLYQTVLHEAAWAGKVDMVALLLDHGANPDVADGHTGETPLHAAVRNDRPDVVAALLAAGADPEQRLGRDSPQCLSGLVYPAGSTARDIARQGGYDEIRVLLEDAMRTR